MTEPTVVCLPTPDAPARLGDLPAGIDLLVWDGSGPPPGGIDRVDLVVGRYSLDAMTPAALAQMPRLRAIQVLTAGVEPWLPVVPDGVTLCSARGVHGASTAELAVTGLVSVLRELPFLYGEQAAHRWTRIESRGLAGARVLVLGAGDIGRRVAAASAAFDAATTLVARTARPGVEPVERLPHLLPHHDAVVVALPHTPQTHRLADAAFLSAMPDGAVLVNVARGGIVDNDALLAELNARRLRAFLDVTDPEPLPPGHPLWDAPNLVLTPHLGGGTRGWEDRAYALVRDQVLRLHAGDPLRNVVADGY